MIPKYHFVLQVGFHFVKQMTSETERTGAGTAFPILAHSELKAVCSPEVCVGTDPLKSGLLAIFRIPFTVALHDPFRNKTLCSL